MMRNEAAYTVLIVIVSLLEIIVYIVKTTKMFLQLAIVDKQPEYW